MRGTLAKMIRRKVKAPPEKKRSYVRTVRGAPIVATGWRRAYQDMKKTIKARKRGGF